MYVRDRVEIATEAQTLRQTPGIHPMKKHNKGEFIFLTPGHKLNLPPAPPLDESQNPYRGLQPFEAQHSELFFGRSQLTKKLKAFVETHPLTVVQGASGAGKSSLIKAGLIPNLKKETDQPWHVLPTIRPGEAPFQALNKALSESQLSTVEPQSPSQTLAQSVTTWSKKNPSLRLLIFIDQSEEIITLCTNETDRHNFFQQILTAIDTHREILHVVLSLRSDFEPQVRDTGLKFAPKVLSKLSHSTLKDRWQLGRFLVPIMTRAELREAIEQPAEARVMHFQPHNLVDQLIDEVADMPGALPLLSFALSELYLKYLKRQQEAQLSGTLIDRALTQADYKALGGVIQSLTQRANQEYEALVSQNIAYSQAIRHVMLRMVAQGGGELTRRRVPLSELDYPPETNSLAQKVIERFSTARLLVKGQDVDGHPYVEPAHDALVKGWGKLQSWLTKEKDLALQRRLTPSALEWKNQQRVKFLWNSNPYLDVLNEVCKSSDNNWLNQIEAEFVQKSLRRRRNDHFRLLGSIVGAFLTISFAGFQWGQSEIGQLDALTRSSQVRFTVNRNSFDALIEALRASQRLQRLPFWVAKEQRQVNVLETLTQSVNWVREENQLIGHADVVGSIRFSPDGQMIATGSYDNTIKLWRRDGSLIKTLKGHTDAVMSIDFSVDSKMIASGSFDGMLRIWDRNGNPIQDVLNQNIGDWVTSVSFGPDGRIVTSSNDTTIKFWQLEEDKLLALNPEKHQDLIGQVRFSPSGDQLITISNDNTLKLWNQDGKVLIKTLDKQAEYSPGVDFSDDGQFFVTVAVGGTVKIWNREGKTIKEIEHPELVYSVNISPDGQTIASGSESGMVRLWTKDGKLLDLWTGHEGLISSVSFSPDGKTLATAGNDGSVKLWQVERNGLAVLDGEQNDILSAKFSADGTRIVGAGQDGTVRLWDRESELLLKLEGHLEPVNAVAISPRGNIIASGSDDGTINIWSEDGQLQKSLLNDTDNKVMAINFSDDGNILASASADGTVTLWDLEGNVIKSLPGENTDRALSVSLSSDGQTIATSGDSSSATLWNYQGQKLQTLTGHDSTIFSVEFSPDGAKLVTASNDQTAKLWRPDGTLITTLTGHTAAVINASFSPDGTMVASASSDHTIKLWRLDGTLITTLTGHTGTVNTVNFSPDSQWLASASADQAVLLWDVSNISLKELLNKGCEHLRNYIETQETETQEGNLEHICS